MLDNNIFSVLLLFHSLSLVAFFSLVYNFAITLFPFQSRQLRNIPLLIRIWAQFNSLVDDEKEKKNRERENKRAKKISNAVVDCMWCVLHNENDFFLFIYYFFFFVFNWCGTFSCYTYIHTHPALVISQRICNFRLNHFQSANMKCYFNIKYNNKITRELLSSFDFWFNDFKICPCVFNCFMYIVSVGAEINKKKKNEEEKW